jgi:hypothetical protein
VFTQHAIQIYWELEIKLDRVELSASSFGRYTSVERAADIHWLGGSMGPGGQEKNPCLCQEWNPDEPARSQLRKGIK